MLNKMNMRPLIRRKTLPQSKKGNLKSRIRNPCAPKKKKKIHVFIT